MYFTDQKATISVKIFHAKTKLTVPSLAGRYKHMEGQVFLVSLS